MAKSLFSKDIEPSCSYCRFGKKASDQGKILCTRKGIVDSTFSCRRFLYDPLKREPHHTAVLGRFSKDDFRL